MKLLFFVLFLGLFFSNSLPGQKINYESSFEKAKRSALEQRKPIAILLTIQTPIIIPNYMDGLNDKTVIEEFNNNFVNYKTDRADTVSSGKIIREFK